MRRKDTKTPAIRAILARRGLKFYPLRARLENRLRQVIGRARLRALLAVMVNRGELVPVGDGDNRAWWLPDVWKAKRRGA